jgi:peptide/nickel transport system permease protein
MSVVTTTPDVITEGRVARAETPWWRFPKRWRNPIGIAGAIIVLVTVFIAIFAPLIAPYDPSAQGAIRLLPPSWDHLMGTDELGRDTFSRIVYGSRVSLQVGILSVAIALAIGGILGLVAGYFGGWADTWTMRLVDIMFAFPGIVLAIVISGLLGPSRRNAMIAIGIIYAPAFARVVRGAVLAVKSEA